MNKFMQRAIELAQNGIDNNIGGPFGAVVVKDNEIVGEGCNMVTSTNDPTAHAEMTAIRNACKNLGTFDLTGCEIYATGEPCPMCFSAIMWSRISKVYFGNSYKETSEINFSDADIHNEILGKTHNVSIERIDAEECLKLYDSWKNKNDKKMY